MSHHEVRLAWLAGLVLPLLFAGCGGGNSPDSGPPQAQQTIYLYRGDGRYDPSQGEVSFPGHQQQTTDGTPVPASLDRSKYCSIYTEQETDDSVRTKLFATLSGSWKRDLSGGDFSPFGASFSISFSSSSSGNGSGTGRGQASLSGALFDPSESITFKRACLSRPVESGRYAGFRILELEADNNEGVALFGVKFIGSARGRSNPVLLLTARKYFRWGSTDAIQGVDAVFAPDDDNESSVRIWVYPEHS